jgi:hypothetical protein
MTARRSVWRATAPRSSRKSGPHSRQINYLDFVRKDKRRGSVAKPDQVHAAIEVIHLPNDLRTIAKSLAAFVVANRAEQAAAFGLLTFHFGVDIHLVLILSDRWIACFISASVRQTNCSGFMPSEFMVNHLFWQSSAIPASQDAHSEVSDCVAWRKMNHSVWRARTQSGLSPGGLSS